MHPYVISQQAPVNLLGRDLLMRLGASILCCADGLTVVLPDGTNWACLAGDTTNGQWLLRPVEPECADIYWGLLEPETPAGGGILSAYLRWKPWVSLLAPYTAPPDPPHVTLFYDRQGDDCYQDWFQENLEGNQWQIVSENIYVGPEGVASAVKLTDAQLQGYKMGQEAVPHVSLALHPEHQAKDLGPMVKKAVETNDWVPSQIPCVSFSPSCRTWCIQLQANDIVALQHEQISRDHGREKTDHPMVAELLASLPDTLWSQGPTDVGLTQCAPISFEVQPTPPIYLHQYPHKPAAEAGISETIAGLINIGVLEPSTSEWNT
ncbi:uncharacterized protein LOC106527544, partial [Austrofundulus limnaeus]|uniref:Uncharacterized protein LOC106527544 n=1 Tax=Austrofundulus limnaeus TaxID=52670 RepID=A0A2I4CD53_AUSLI